MSDETRNGDGFIAVAEDLKKHFGSGSVAVRAVDGVSFRLPRDKMVALRGPSGCGKSTLLNLLGALDRPDSGRLDVDGIDVSGLSGGREVAYRSGKVGFVFQQFNLIPQLSALENVTLPMEFSNSNGRAPPTARAKELLSHVGLTEDRQGRRPAKLSGGEQQRVAIARALANDPALVLADEPTANLDSETGKLIIRLLHGLCQEGHTVVIATHDEAIAAKADLVLEMRDGRLVEAGSERRSMEI